MEIYIPWKLEKVQRCTHCEFTGEMRAQDFQGSIMKWEQKLLIQACTELTQSKEIMQITCKYVVGCHSSMSHVVVCLKSTRIMMMNLQIDLQRPGSHIHMLPR